MQHIEIFTRLSLLFLFLYKIRVIIYCKFIRQIGNKWSISVNSAFNTRMRRRSRRDLNIASSCTSVEPVAWFIEIKLEAHPLITITIPSWEILHVDSRSFDPRAVFLSACRTFRGNSRLGKSSFFSQVPRSALPQCARYVLPLGEGRGVKHLRVTR